MVFVISVILVCCITGVYAGDPTTENEKYSVDATYVSYTGDGSIPVTEPAPDILLSVMQGLPGSVGESDRGIVIQFPDPSGEQWSGHFYNILPGGLGYAELPATSIRGYGEDCPFVNITRDNIRISAGNSVFLTHQSNGNGINSFLNNYRNSPVSYL